MNILLYICKKLESMKKIEVRKDRNTNKVMFFLNGKQVYPISVSGNICKFSNGQNILI